MENKRDFFNYTGVLIVSSRLPEDDFLYNLNFDTAQAIFDTILRLPEMEKDAFFVTFAYMISMGKTFNEVNFQDDGGKETAQCYAVADDFINAVEGLSAGEKEAFVAIFIDHQDGNLDTFESWYSCTL